MGDDTFIHIGFIKDFASGNGFSFAGNRTYGSTSPMWVILNAGLTKIIASPELSVRILSAFFTLTTVYLLYIVLAKSNLDKIIILAAVSSLVLNPFFLRWALTGMEATAAMSLLLYIYHLYFQKSNIQSKYPGGIVFGVAVLIRPEFLGFLIIFIVYALFKKSDSNRSFYLSLIIAIGIIFAWIIFSYFYFGTIIPNTYTAKAGDSITGFHFDNMIRTIKLFIAGNFPEFILLVMILGTATFFSIRKKNQFKLFSFFKSVLIEKRLVLPLLWIAGFYIFYIIKDVTVISRYSLLLIPFIIFIVISYLDELQKIIGSKFTYAITALYFVSIVVVFVWMTFTVVKPASDDFVNGFQKTYHHIASIIKEDSRHHNVSVALSDVGMIGCYSGARIYDLAGLVDEKRFDYKSYIDYLAADKPDYLILREEHKLDDVLPSNVYTKILFKKHIAGFGINHANPRTVTLYKLSW